MSIETIHQWTGTAVDLALLAGAIAAAIRFRILNVLGRRWSSDVKCSHVMLSNQAVVFVAEYVITNTGRRSMQLGSTEIRLVPAQSEGALLVPDEKTTIAARLLEATDPRYAALFRIEPGERSIFTLRCRLPRLDEVVFVLCSFSLIGKRHPASFQGFYVRRHIARLHDEGGSAGAGGPGDDEDGKA